MAGKRNNDIVIGLGFGDESKGSMVSYLASTYNAKYVVRASGGPQNAHNVIDENGVHHTFAQFGSGTLHDIPTIVSRFCIVNPFNMAAEADALEGKIGYDPFKITYVSNQALLATPFHVAANQAREIRRGANAHGSCGQGVGEVMDYHLNSGHVAPRIWDIDLNSEDNDLSGLRGMMQIMRRHYVAQFPEFDFPKVDEVMESYVAFVRDGRMQIESDGMLAGRMNEGYTVFEGSQGVLLDEWLGFHPHTTWSTTTAANAQALLAESTYERGNVIGVTRSYATRHGAGPFPSELPADPERFPEAHNTWGRFQGGWRAGLLDLQLLDYAVQAAKDVNEIAITHCDVIPNEIVSAYIVPNRQQLTPAFDHDLVRQEGVTKFLSGIEPGMLHHEPLIDFEDLRTRVEEATRRPVKYASYGPRTDQKVELL